MSTSYRKSSIITSNHPHMVRKEKEIVNQQILSQKLDQLSPFQNKSNINNMMIEQETIVGINFNLVPDYLCKKNQDFEKKIGSILPSTMNLEDLRDIAILRHKIISIEIYQSLWIVYRKSGIGELPSTLKINALEKKIWSKEVLYLMKKSQIQYTNENDACLTFVNYCLQELNNKNEQYRQELQIKINRLHGYYTQSLAHIIEKFIQQKGLQFLRLDIDQQIAMVQYYYMDQILKRIYYAQNPNEEQIKIMKHLCKLKYNQEITKYEVDLLKEKMLTYIPLHPFERNSIAKSSLIDSIQNSKMKQQIYKQYKTVAEQARNNLITISMACAQEQKYYYEKQYDIALEEIWKHEKILSSNQQLTKTMWDLIKQLSDNISTCIECLYKFKKQLFHLKSNTD